MMGERPPERTCPVCDTVLPEVAPERLCPTCTIEALVGGSPMESIVSAAPEISGITVHEEIGEGGFGIVYRATETGTVQRRVALKVLKPGVDTRQVLRRFQVERQALALLEHPNIARIYQAGETKDGYPYFTMEFIEGIPITDYLAARELAEIGEVFQIVCGAVAHAHRKGVIHRDLKPSNILVTLEGVPKVIDFGVAKATDPENTPGMTLFTGSDSWLGTPAYMAPEQARENELDVDERADVYALGAILYEVLTGMTPLEAATGRATRDAIGSAQIPLASEVAIRKIPKDLDRILGSSLVEAPERRYQSVGEFSADLRRFLSGERLEASPRRKVDRWWWLVAAVAGLIVLGLIVRDKSEKDRGEIGEVFSSEVHVSSGAAYQIVLSPDGARGLGLFRHGGRAILFSCEDGKEEGSVPVISSPIRSGAFSEDGRRFLLGLNNGVIRWYASDGGRPLSSYPFASD